MRTAALLLFAFLNSQLLSAQQGQFNQNLVVSGISCPQFVITNTDLGLCSTSAVILGAPAGTGTFVIDSLMNDAPAIFPEGITVVTWEATDATGNKATCQQMVAVKDNEAPHVICQADQYRSTDPGSCSYLTIGDEFDPVSLSDNCPGFYATNELNNLGTLDAISLPQGTTEITWIISDQNYNTTTCNVRITVEDNEAPMIQCLNDPDRNTDQGSSFYHVTGAEFDPLLFDNCGGYTLINNINSFNTLAGAVFAIGATSVEWVITDASGNTSICGFVVHINDNELPVIICREDQVRSTDQEVCNYTVSGTEFDPLSFSDNCGNLIMYNDYNGSASLAGSIFIKGNTAVSWSLIDVGGNISNCSFNVTIKDNEAPVFICPGDQTRSLGSGVSDYIVLNNEFDPVYADNCSGVTTINYINSLNTLNGALFTPGTSAVTWLFTDEDYNTSSCSFNVTVNAGKSGTDLAIEKDYEQGLSSGYVLPDKSGKDNADFSSKNYPNPFSDKTIISFVPAKDDNIVLDVYDISGRLIESLYKGPVYKNEAYAFILDGRKLPEGIYMYKITTNDQVVQREMILLNK
jgi:hypothetical protein